MENKLQVTRGHQRDEIVGNQLIETCYRILGNFQPQPGTLV
jgi:hypothetical protein